MAEIHVGKFINNLDTEDLTSEKLQGVVNNVYAKAIKDHKKTAKKADDNLKQADEDTVEFEKSNHDRLKASEDKVAKDLNKDDAKEVKPEGKTAKGVEETRGSAVLESVDSEIAKLEQKKHSIANRLDAMVAKNPDAEHTRKFKQLESEMESLAFEIEELKSKSVLESKQVKEDFERKLEPGDKIIVRGNEVTIGGIFDQFFDKKFIDIEFVDNEGRYRTWKSDIDGGKVVYKESKQVKEDYYDDYWAEKTTDHLIKLVKEIAKKGNLAEYKLTPSDFYEIWDDVKELKRNRSFDTINQNVADFFNENSNAICYSKGTGWHFEANNKYESKNTRKSAKKVNETQELNAKTPFRKKVNEASYRGLAYYEYKGCHVRETPSCFVATNEYGTTLGQSQTKYGAEAIIDDYVSKKGKKTVGESKKLREADGENMTIETSTSILDMFYPSLYQTIDDYYIPDNEWDRVDDILANTSMEFAERAIKQVFPRATLKFKELRHPREYNYGGENIIFDVTLPRADYESVKEDIILDPGFEGFLKKNSPRSGYIPFGAYTIDKFKTQDDMYSIGQIVKFMADDEDMSYDFDEEFREEISNNFETYDYLWEEIMDWLREHDQAYQDFLTHFHADENSVIDLDSIFGWISEHDTLAQDFENRFGISLGESLIKESAEKIQPGNIYSVLVKELPAEDIDHHDSDLYVRKTPKSTEIINRLTTKSLLSTFKDNIDGDIWYELPFCFSPHFQKEGLNEETFRELGLEQDDEVVYEFPELTKEDIRMARRFGLKNVTDAWGTDIEGFEEDTFLQGTLKDIKNFAREIEYILVDGFLFDTDGNQIDLDDEGNLVDGQDDFIDLRAQWEDLSDKIKIIEFDNGDYYYIDVDWDEDVIFAGTATNTGVIREYELDLDPEYTIDELIAELYDAIVEDRPELIGESKKLTESPKKPSQEEEDIRELLNSGWILKISRRNYTPTEFKLVGNDVYYNNKEISFGWNKHPTLDLDGLIEHAIRLQNEGFFLNFDKKEDKKLSEGDQDVTPRVDSKIYKHLTDKEWNAISQFTADNNLDTVFDIAEDEDGDFFFDFELDKKVPFEEYLCYLADNIYTDGVYYPKYDHEFRELLSSIFDKYCGNEKVKQYVKSVNKQLDEKERIAKVVWGEQVEESLTEDNNSGSRLSGFRSEELDDIFKVGAKFKLNKPMELERYIPDDWVYDYDEENGFSEEDLEQMKDYFRQDLEDSEQYDTEILDKYIVADRLDGIKLELPIGFELTVAENIPNTEWFNGNPWFTEVVFDTKDGQIRQFYNSVPGPTFIAHNS